MNIEKVIRLRGFYDKEDSLHPIIVEDKIIGSAEPDIIVDLEEVSNSLDIVGVTSLFMEEKSVNKDVITSYCLKAKELGLSPNVGLALVDAKLLYQGETLPLEGDGVEDILNCYIEVFPSIYRRLLSIGNNHENFNNKDYSTKFTNIYNAYINSKDNMSIEAELVENRLSGGAINYDTSLTEKEVEDSKVLEEYNQFELNETDEESVEGEIELDEFKPLVLDEEKKSLPVVDEFSSAFGGIMQSKSDNSQQELPVEIEPKSQQQNEQQEVSQLEEVEDETKMESDLETSSDSSDEKGVESGDYVHETLEGSPLPPLPPLTESEQKFLLESEDEEIITNEQLPTSEIKVEDDSEIQVIKHEEDEKTTPKELVESSSTIDFASSPKISELMPHDKKSIQDYDYNVEQSASIATIAEGTNKTVEELVSEEAVGETAEETTVEVIGEVKDGTEVENESEHALLEVNPIHSFGTSAMRKLSETQMEKAITLSKSMSLTETPKYEEHYSLLLEINSHYEKLIGDIELKHLQEINKKEEGYIAIIESLKLKVKSFEVLGEDTSKIAIDKLKLEHNEEINKLNEHITFLTKLVEESKKGDELPDELKERNKVKKEQSIAEDLKRQEIIKSSATFIDRNSEKPEIISPAIHGYNGNTIIDSKGITCKSISESGKPSQLLLAPSNRKANDIRNKFAKQFMEIEEV